MKDYKGRRKDYGKEGINKGRKDYIKEGREGKRKEGDTLFVLIHAVYADLVWLWGCRPR